MKLKKETKTGIRKIELTDEVQISAFLKNGWKEILDNESKPEKPKETEAEAETDGSVAETDKKPKK